MVGENLENGSLNRWVFGIAGVFQGHRKEDICANMQTETWPDPALRHRQALAGLRRL
jgi:hypothetical protein